MSGLRPDRLATAELKLDRDLASAPVPQVPADLAARIVQQVTGMPQKSPAQVEPDAAPAPRALRRWAAACAALASVGVALVAGNSLLTGGDAMPEAEMLVAVADPVVAPGNAADAAPAAVRPASRQTVERLALAVAPEAPAVILPMRDDDELATAEAAIDIAGLAREVRETDLQIVADGHHELTPPHRLLAQPMGPEVPGGAVGSAIYGPTMSEGFGVVGGAPSMPRTSPMGGGQMGLPPSR